MKQPNSINYTQIEQISQEHKTKNIVLDNIPFFSISLFFIFILIFICSFYYIDYGTTLMINGRGPSRFRAENDEECDYFDGKWVWDETLTYPLYDSKDCAFIDDSFRCLENNRPDNSYTKWRWQPNHCDLPRFDAKVMLEKLRNKRLVFVGDSIGRNQWESLLCILSSAILDKDSIYEVNGNPITKHKGYLVFRFKDYNCTIEYYRAPFLVVQDRPPVDAPEYVKYALRVDQLEWTSPKWKDADVLIFNAGHWWTYDRTIRSDVYFQEGNELKMNMTVDTAFRRSIETVASWINDQVNTSKTTVYFRTYAPLHFRGVDWKNGGKCHLETMPDLKAPNLPETWDHYNIVKSVLWDRANMSNVNGLEVTYMTLQRKDGHPSLYFMGREPAPMHRQDCSHWCLPGVPDTWNELLYAVFLRQMSHHSVNTSNPSQARA